VSLGGALQKNLTLTRGLFYCLEESMNIRNKDIEILKNNYEEFTPDCFEIIREIVVEGKYLIAGLEKIEPYDNQSYWIIPTNVGDDDFINFLRSKGIINKEFASTYRVEQEIFPLVIEFLANKSDDYLDYRTSSTTPIYVDQEKEDESKKDCYDHRRSKSFRMASVQHIQT